MRFVIPTLLVALSAAVIPARAGSVLGDDYSIMKPEPWLAPKYRSPRGTTQRPKRIKPSPPVETRLGEPPPPVVVPQTGRVLPNLAPSAGSVGPRGVESMQDRVIRCTHQAGIYGAGAGDRGSYMGSCVNQ